MINTEKFNQIVETAKAKAANDPKWLRAIERAAREILSGEMIVSLFADYTALVTTPNGQYRVNGHCACKAAQNGHTQCAHRAAKKIWTLYEEAACKAALPVELRRDIAESSRQALLIEIRNIWKQIETTPLEVALMARFGVNQLEMLNDSLLRDIRLAIAM